jgi:hypothetical protein
MPSTKRARSRHLYSTYAPTSRVVRRRYVYRNFRVDYSSDVPKWILAVGGAGIVLGLATYGEGQHSTRSTPPAVAWRGACKPPAMPPCVRPAFQHRWGPSRRASSSMRASREAQQPARATRTLAGACAWHETRPCVHQGSGVQSYGEARVRGCRAARVRSLHLAPGLSPGLSPGHPQRATARRAPLAPSPRSARLQHHPRHRHPAVRDHALARLLHRAGHGRGGGRGLLVRTARLHHALPGTYDSCTSCQVVMTRASLHLEPRFQAGTNRLSLPS